MSTPEVWTPARAASKVIKIVEAFSAVHGMDRFPIDIRTVALEAAGMFGWSDPITEVRAARIDRFHGALFPNDERTKWLLLYNDELASQGRVRFTQAHELGHYILHRTRQHAFHCGDGEVLGWPGDTSGIESQADTFASYLLMPIDDFRRQLNSEVDLDVLGHCATRYGVSLTAAVLKWLQFTDEKAVLVVSRDGYVDWAWSSEPAYRSGAFLRARQELVEVPSGTLASDESVGTERTGRAVDASKWFKHAEKGLSLREMKLQTERFGYTLTLLIMPRLSSYWSPFSSPPPRR